MKNIFGESTLHHQLTLFWPENGEIWWNWLCRHACQTISTSADGGLSGGSRVRGPPSVLAKFLIVAWFTSTLDSLLHKVWECSVSAALGCGHQRRWPLLSVNFLLLRSMTTDLCPKCPSSQVSTRLCQGTYGPCDRKEWPSGGLESSLLQEVWERSVSAVSLFPRWLG